MTMIVSAVGDDFALMAADMCTFRQDRPGGDWVPCLPFRNTAKVRVVGADVLVACAGDVVLAENFTRGLLERVDVDDDLDRVVNAAREVTRDLWAVDRPDEPAVYRNRFLRQGSIKTPGDGGFGCVFAGFRNTGQPGLAVHRTGQREADPVESDPLEALWQMVAPYGVPENELWQFTSWAARRLEDALPRVLSVFRHVRARYPDRVDQEGGFAAVVRGHDGELQRFERTLAWDDVPGLLALSDELTAPRTTAAEV